jgi:ATP-binding cassette subfamily F protein 2
MCLVSHDFRLIDQVAKEIWLCDDNKITKFDGNIHQYKDVLKQHVKNEEKKFQESLVGK